MIEEFNSLLGCYTEVSQALRDALAVAQTHVDLPTWRNLLMREMPNVNLDGRAYGTHQKMPAAIRHWCLHPPSQQLPWEPALIAVNAIFNEMPTPMELELRTLCEGKALSPELQARVDTIVADLNKLTEERAALLGSAMIKFQIWSAPRGSNLVLGPTESAPADDWVHVGNCFTMADMTAVGNGLFLMQWPRIFGCEHNVVPSLRCLHMEVAAEPGTALDNLTVEFVKANTQRAKRFDAILRA